MNWNKTIDWLADNEYWFGNRLYEWANRKERYTVHISGGYKLSRHKLRWERYPIRLFFDLWSETIQKIKEVIWNHSQC